MSDISKLYIFTKDTDATASIRGYQYQILKTLETWLLNFKNDIHEEIFCDYEDDVFQKNEIAQSARFRQIKLYSSNFSFKSEEIIKCIAHFFMLHVKSDYKNIEREFVFEANTTIAKKYLDNDAELLREWSENQKALSEDLLSKCSKKVKEIVSEYVKDQAKALKDKVDKNTIDEAISIFDKLEDKDWDDFTRKIKWNFLNVDSESEMKFIKDNIDNLILGLKYSIKAGEASSVFGLLYNTVWEKASESAPENRKLINAELEFHILNISRNDKDQWYIKAYNEWKEVEKINLFRIGEFYEIIDVVRHCRRHKYLFNHSELWLKILNWYISELDTPIEFKKTALYEYIWLKIQFSSYKELPQGSLKGAEAYVHEYFSDFDDFKNANDIENAQNILNIIRFAVAFSLADITPNVIVEWESKLEELINKYLGTFNNPNEICHLLENLVTSKLFHFISRQNNELKDIQELFEQIMVLSNEATYYNISQLSTRINEYIKIILSATENTNYELIYFLENYSERLADIVLKRQGNYEAAKIQIDRGVSYLNKTEPFFYLKALSCFHKAKDLWNQQETIEGHILALLNISQLYAGMDMNLAARYYALSGVWLSVYNGEEKLLRRIADSLGMLFHADFKQGSWMSAFVDFKHYIIARHEFYSDPIDFKDKLTMSLESIGDFALVVYSSNLIQPDLKYLVENEIKKAGYLNDEYITSLLEDLSNKLPNIDTLHERLKAKISDNPLSDVGKRRIINFMALGSKWEITFDNDYTTNSIAEEFVSILQILLCEIALSNNIDFHLTKGIVKIDIEIKDGINQPEELPSHDSFSWKVFVPYFDGKKPEEINLNNASSLSVLMIILNRISLLPDEEFQSLFETFFTNNSLSTKTLSLNAYQKMYRLVFSKEEFDSLQRQNFSSPNVTIEGLPKENNVVKWKSDLSLKYNHDLSIEYISNRYKSSQKCIYLTLEKLSGNAEFHILINKLRKEGWEDWFIILAMLNFILSHKANRELETLDIKDDEEGKRKFEELFFKFRDLDENDYYVEFPIEVFRGKWFGFQIQSTCVIVLKSFGLENKAKFPNFKAIKEFLDVRFNMSKDKNDIDNPLAIIPINID
ncbi:hypothetical protein EZS27_021673 [termite gut metagenome]|uniref:CD-NTase associated protein 4-like DNA endonuclease domain-containing protein n=1 Tax=termite gut metagenome TaxID=433724 RepID=A0A5J4R7A4_9ZZZZ